MVVPIFHEANECSKSINYQVNKADTIIVYSMPTLTSGPDSFISEMFRLNVHSKFISL